MRKDSESDFDLSSANVSSLSPPSLPAGMADENFQTTSDEPSTAMDLSSCALNSIDRPGGLEVRASASQLRFSVSCHFRCHSGCWESIAGIGSSNFFSALAIESLSQACLAACRVVGIFMKGSGFGLFPSI